MTKRAGIPHAGWESHTVRGDPTGGGVFPQVGGWGWAIPQRGRARWSRVGAAGGGIPQNGGVIPQKKPPREPRAGQLRAGARGAERAERLWQGLLPLPLPRRAGIGAAGPADDDDDATNATRRETHRGRRVDVGAADALRLLMNNVKRLSAQADNIIQPPRTPAAAQPRHEHEHETVTVTGSNGTIITPHLGESSTT